MDDKSLREDEIFAIKSIYEEEDIFSYDDDNLSGNFFVKFESPTQFQLLLVSEKCSLKLKHLPPIQLSFQLPPDYPSKTAPTYTLSAHWISTSNLDRLCSKLDELWTQNSFSSILFTWISFLGDELFDYLDLNPDQLEIEEETNVAENESNTKQRCFKLPCSANLLKKYDSDQEEARFFASYYSCAVCFEEKLGKDCFQFAKCEHTYCKECMRTYFETQIADGNVKSLTCPFDKCESQAQPGQVLALVGLDIFNRYDSLLLKDSLNSMLDIVYCPRAQCQCAVIPEETLAHCTGCEYVFCSLCRQGYHGIEPCKITNTQLKQICQAYETGDETVRAKLINQYGEKRLKRAMEESLSMDLITVTSKQCPNCRSWLQKLDGCNKMTCTKCLCYFCWLCMAKLSKIDPYSHFNSPNSVCYNLLFEGVIHNDNDDNEEGGNNQMLVIQEGDTDDEEMAMNMQLEELNAR